MDDKIGEWSHKGAYSKAGTWTISGCTVGKPLLIIMQNQAYTYAGCAIVAISGCKYPDGSSWSSTSLNAMYLMGSQYGGNISVFIPSSSTVALRVGNWNNAGSKLSLHAYN